MSVLTVEIPPGVDAAQLRLAVAIQLFKEGSVSTGRGAQISELSRERFIDELGKRSVPVIDYPSDELEEELRSWSGTRS